MTTIDNRRIELTKKDELLDLAWDAYKVGRWAAHLNHALDEMDLPIAKRKFYFYFCTKFISEKHIFHTSNADGIHPKVYIYCDAKVVYMKRHDLRTIIRTCMKYVMDDVSISVVDEIIKMDLMARSIMIDHDIVNRPAADIADILKFIIEEGSNDGE